MRKIIPMIALALSATTVHARDISAGTVMFTGDSSFEIGSTDVKTSSGTTTTDSTEINLTGIYFAAKNFGIGLMLGSEDTETDDGSTVTDESMTMFGPVVGYNISLNREASIVLHASVFTIGGDMDSDTGFEADIDGEGYMLGGFYNHFLSDSVALNVGLRMLDADIDFSSGGSTESADMEQTSASAGLSVFF